MQSTTISLQCGICNQVISYPKELLQYLEHEDRRSIEPTKNYICPRCKSGT